QFLPIRLARLGKRLRRIRRSEGELDRLHTAGEERACHPDGILAPLSAHNRDETRSSNLTELGVRPHASLSEFLTLPDFSAKIEASTVLQLTADL
ncbi:MAG TPA: hypothetical protein VF221_09080, partial [Chloroflexota bacterium]